MKIRNILILVLSILPFGVANSIPITMDFTASGFSAGAPDASISGSFQWDAASVNATIDSLTSVDLTIDGQSYALGDVDYQSPFGGGSTDILFGSLNGLGIASGTNDFWLRWNRDTLTAFDFAYSATGVAFFQTLNFDTFTITAVSEPVSLALMGLGLVGLGFARKRKDS